MAQIGDAQHDRFQRVSHGATCNANPYCAATSNAALTIVASGMLSGVHTAVDIDQSLEAFDGAIKAMLQEGLIRADEGVMGCGGGREGPRCGEECRQGIIHQWKQDSKDPICTTTGQRSWCMPWVMASCGKVRAS